MFLTQNDINIRNILYLMKGKGRVTCSLCISPCGNRVGEK